jgi:phosphomevalonate kinase
MEAKKAFTCPSKVLIMGGYAILSEQCFGLTVGLNERFFAYLAESNSSKAEEEVADDNTKIISFYSNQISSEWHYKLRINEASCEDLSSSPNPFLESVVRVLGCSVPPK